MDCLYFRERPERELSLVLVHGFLGDALALDRVRTRCERAFLRAESLVIPGHAGTVFEPDWRWPAVVSRMNDRVEAEGNVIVGYSMGARLALSMVLAAPERYAGAVLVGVDPGIEDERAREERQRWERAMSESVASDGLDAFVERWESLPVFASQQKLQDEVRRELRARRAQHAPEAIAWAMRALGTGSMPSQWRALAALSVRTVVVTGALDEKFTAIGRKMALCNARITHTAVEGVGHDVTIEAPDAVAEAVTIVREEAVRR